MLRVWIKKKNILVRSWSFGGLTQGAGQTFHLDVMTLAGKKARAPSSGRHGLQHYLDQRL